MMRRSSFTTWAAISGCLLERGGHSVSFGQHLLSLLPDTGDLHFV